MRLLTCEEIEEKVEVGEEGHKKQLVVWTCKGIGVLSQVNVHLTFFLLSPSMPQTACRGCDKSMISSISTADRRRPTVFEPDDVPSSRFGAQNCHQLVV